MKLYGYWRSSAAYRVRIALALKGLPWDPVYIHLVKDGGINLKPEYRAVNPSAKIPTLEIDGTPLGQSLAIIEYLDETHPNPPFLPADPLLKAKARAFAYTIACDIHPLNNIKIANYLRTEGGWGKDEIFAWARTWIADGFSALEETLKRDGWQSRFAFGDAPGLAEICLVPQMYNARRWDFDFSPYPRLVAIDEAARAHPAFETAAPDAQPDAEVP